MTSRHDRQNRLPGLPVRKLLLAGIVLVALIVSLTAYETFSRRDRAYAAVERDLNLLATAMSGYTARTFQSLELMLRNIETDLDDLKLDRSADMAEATRILRQRQSDFPMLASLNLLGSEGELLAAAIAVLAYTHRIAFTSGNWSGRVGFLPELLFLTGGFFAVLACGVGYFT